MFHPWLSVCCRLTAAFCCSQRCRALLSAGRCRPCRFLDLARLSAADRQDTENKNSPRSMRILHVVPTYLPATRYGGPIVAVHSLCRALAARGHAVEVFTTSIDGPLDSAVPYDAPVMLDGVKVRYFASRLLRRLSWAPALARTLQRDMAGADAVHLHSVFLWPTWAAARLAARSAIPYVISPRGMLVDKLIASRHHLLKSAW